MKPVIAAVFDLDGLLLDTEAIYDEMFQDYIRDVSGAPLETEAFRQMRARMFGGKALDSARILLQTIGSDLPPEHHLEWRQSYDLESRFSKTRAMPGAEKLLAALRAKGLPLALATSSTKPLLAAKTLPHPWVLDAFGSNIVMAEDVVHGKPHPEAFCKAAQKLNVPLEHYPRVLVLEDAPNGVEAAKAAGMKVVAVPHPLLDRQLVGQADEVLDSLEQFNPGRWDI